MTTVPYTYRDTLLKIDHVSFSYGTHLILRDVCAEIKDVYIPGRVTGQVVALLGPSGRGKSTIFRTMAGLLRPTAGQVLIADPTGFHPVRVGEVGVVAQNYPLFAHRTIKGNLRLAAKAHTKSDLHAGDTVNYGLVSFGLSDKADLYPCQLSGGQQQRVAILQMLICEEPVILMDEPFASLDLINIEIVCEAISKAANASELNTIIVVTHDVTAAVAIADHIWLLGYEYDAAGKAIPGARIVKTYDLLDRGLCYEPGIITSDAAMATIKEIKGEFRRL